MTGLDRELDCFGAGDDVRPVHAARPHSLPGLLASLPEAQAAYLAGSRFTAARGQVVLLPGAKGVAAAVLGLGEGTDPHVFGALPAALPPGFWSWGQGVDDPAAAAMGYALGAYSFKAMGQAPAAPRPLLVLPDAPGMAEACRAARATWLTRDLINTPPNLLGPAELAACARDVLVRRGAHAQVITGAALAAGYPAIASVGRGSARPAQVLMAQWSSPRAPADAILVSLCGKGVCFDTGGYDIKPSAGMLRMKKDMGGAAIALALACMIIEADLPVRLELRLGCVENMISGEAMRPSDVLATRAGLRVEVGNTDAEGRLVLCDLLSEASEQQPDMLLDFATLTGAARVALGPDLPALFTNDEGLADLFLEAGRAAHDPVWRLPLWDGYNSWLESAVADLNNVSEKTLGGAITAALFLQRFVFAGTRWAHFDVYAWNDSGRPGLPVGGEAQTLRGVFAGIAARAASGRGHASGDDPD